MDRSLPVLVLAVATSCTSQLTPSGASVRAVTRAATERCTRLAAVEGSGANGASAEENERAATNDLRNRVAKLGGNAYAITAREAGVWRSVVQADAYRCPEWEPVPGLAPR